MCDEFRRKLDDYHHQRLSEEEQAAFEKELEKLEIYQTYIESELTSSEHQGRGGTVMSGQESVKKEIRMIRRGKWKARFHNVVMVLVFFMIISILSGMVTSAFFTLGRPNRMDTYRRVLTAAYAVTSPNVRLGSSGLSVNNFFTADYRGTLTKRVGAEDMYIGELDISFLFHQASYPKKRVYTGIHNPTFYYPGSTMSERPLSDWGILQRLPEGTVAEAFISLDRLYALDEILPFFQDLELEPVWFAVDTGLDDPEHPLFSGPIGFPYIPIWLSDDQKITSREVEKGPLFSRTVTELVEMPRIDPYGDGALREENFIKLLQLLKRHQTVAERVTNVYPLALSERMRYLEEHGVRIYGMVVTGPTKEILALQDISWVSTVTTGEVAFTNWR